MLRSDPASPSRLSSITKSRWSAASRRTLNGVNVCTLKLIDDVIAIVLGDPIADSRDVEPPGGVVRVGRRGGADDPARVGTARARRPDGRRDQAAQGETCADAIRERAEARHLKSQASITEGSGHRSATRWTLRRTGDVAGSSSTGCSGGSLSWRGAGLARPVPSAREPGPRDRCWPRTPGSLRPLAASRSSSPG